MIAGVNGVEAAKYGKHCPFFKFGCMLSTDENDKPIVSQTLQLVKNTIWFKGRCRPDFPLMQKLNQLAFN